MGVAVNICGPEHAHLLYRQLEGGDYHGRTNQKTVGSTGRSPWMKLDAQHDLSDICTSLKGSFANISATAAAAAAARDKASLRKATVSMQRLKVWVDKLHESYKQLLSMQMSEDKSKSGHSKKMMAAFRQSYTEEFVPLVQDIYGALDDPMPAFVGGGGEEGKEVSSGAKR